MSNQNNSSGITIKKGADLNELVANLQKIAGVEVLVGFPEDTTERDPDGDTPTGITNASLAYIHDNGAPEQNIPARPFMAPGIESVQDKLADKLGQILKAAANGAPASTIAQGMTQVGIIAATGIKNTINEGIDPPLAPATLRARAARGRKGAQEELNRRKKGEAPSTAFAKPLVDTGELRNAVSYAIRPRNQRK